jgi:hypothetical protein
MNRGDSTLKLRFPIHVHISTLFVILLLVVGGIIGSLGYQISRDILKSMAGELSGRIQRAAMRELTNLISPAEMATRLLSLDVITQAKSLEKRLESLDFLREALNNSPGLTSLYIGYGNGDFFLIRTLSEEERYKIKEHIVQTLIMLSQLPFPKHLRQVPEIASGHHEKMDGTGYPKGLRGEDMSPLARMLAIADIFEALTAVDRPYKKGNTFGNHQNNVADEKR